MSDQTFTEALANHVHDLRARNRQLQKELAKVRKSRQMWQAKAARLDIDAKHLAARNRVLLIDKANLIAERVIRS